MFWVFWCVVLILAILVEALTAELVAVWFFPAALVAMIMAFCGAPVYWQFPVFVVLGFTLVLATRPLAKKFGKGKREKTNVDTLVGEHAVVTEEISNLAEKGEVKVKGLLWSARSAAESVVIPVGATVTVKEISGVKLIVEETK